MACDPRAAGRAVPGRRAAERQHLGDVLSGASAQTRREQRHAGASSSRSPASTACATSRASSTSAGPGEHHVTFAQGTEPRHRAGPGPEQGAAGDPAPAARGAAAGHRRHQVADELPLDRRDLRRTDKPTERRHRRLPRAARSRTRSPRQRRRRRSRCSARSTRCASGSIRPSCQRYGLTPLGHRRRDPRAERRRFRPGKIGSLPAPPGQQLNATVTAQSRLPTPDAVQRDHRQARHRAARIVRLGDVARVELGTESYDFETQLQRQPGGGHGHQARAGRERARHRQARQGTTSTDLQRTFPPGRQGRLSRSTRRRSCASRSRRS